MNTCRGLCWNVAIIDVGEGVPQKERGGEAGSPGGGGGARHPEEAYAVTDFYRGRKVLAWGMYL